MCLLKQRYLPVSVGCINMITHWHTVDYVTRNKHISDSVDCFTDSAYAMFDNGCGVIKCLYRRNLLKLLEIKSENIFTVAHRLLFLFCFYIVTFILISFAGNASLNSHCILNTEAAKRNLFNNNTVLYCNQYKEIERVIAISLPYSKKVIQQSSNIIIIIHLMIVLNSYTHIILSN